MKEAIDNHSYSHFTLHPVISLIRMKMIYLALNKGLAPTVQKLYANSHLAIWWSKQKIGTVVNH
jgi:hypothetical protein